MKKQKKNFIDHRGRMPHQVPANLEYVSFEDCWIGEVSYQRAQISYMYIGEDEMRFILDGSVDGSDYIHAAQNVVRVGVKLQDKAEPVYYTVRWDPDDDEHEETKWQRSAFRDGELWLWLKRGEYQSSTRDEDDRRAQVFIRHGGKTVCLGGLEPEP